MNPRPGAGCRGLGIRRTLNPNPENFSTVLWRRYEREFLADLDALGVRRPDLMPRVSDYVPQIVEYIAQIQANGLAYENEGSVYFDTTAFECALPPFAFPPPSACAPT